MATLEQLSEQHAAALSQAREYIDTRFDPWLILAAGSIVRGNPDLGSDLDIYVLHDAQYRQRIQRWFNDVAVEIFVNPESTVDEYIRSEAGEGRPFTAHMIATGIVLHSEDDLRTQALRSRAAHSLASPPQVDEASLTQSRYGAATSVEDALDKRASDPETAMRILAGAVEEMVAHWYRKEGRYCPRRKDVLSDFESADPRLGALARTFWSDAGPAERWTAALALADEVLGTRGFFEWESEEEDTVE